MNGHFKTKAFEYGLAWHRYPDSYQIPEKILRSHQCGQNPDRYWTSDRLGHRHTNRARPVSLYGLCTQNTGEGDVGPLMFWVHDFRVLCASIQSFSGLFTPSTVTCISTVWYESTNVAGANHITPYARSCWHWLVETMKQKVSSLWLRSILGVWLITLHLGERSPVTLQIMLASALSIALLNGALFMTVISVYFRVLYL